MAGSEEEYRREVETGKVSGGEILYNHSHFGLIPRDRLFNEILAALWRDFDSTSRAALVKLHGLLEPTPEELLQQQAEFRKLLSNPVSANVTFALKTLKSIRKAEQFEAAATIEALPSTFEIPTKTQPKTALGFLKMLSGRRKPTNDFVIDFRIGKGLSRDAEDLFVGLGGGIRF